jgi:hypothetical protein
MLNRAALEVDLEERVAEPVARGITATELAARTRFHTYSVSAFELRRWLIENHLAIVVGGRFVPTSLGLEIGAALG